MSDTYHSENNGNSDTAKPIVLYQIHLESNSNNDHNFGQSEEDIYSTDRRMQEADGIVQFNEDQEKPLRSYLFKIWKLLLEIFNLFII